MAWKGLVLSVAVAAAACATGGETPLKELQRARSGALDVVLLSPGAGIRKGMDSFTMEFRSFDGELLDVGTVKVKATMPMAGMAPMAGDVTVQPGDVRGRYAVSSNLSMVGTWRLDVEWNGPAGSGMATLSTAAE